MRVDLKGLLDKRTAWGLLLAVIGAMLLLQTTGVVGNAGALTVGLAFIGGGGVMLTVFLSDRRHWWAIFPAGSLAAIGVMITLSQALPGFRLMGSLFLGGLGLCFWVVYFVRRDHFWPIIPGGVLVTLALVAGMEAIIPFFNVGGLFFMGLGTTFALVFALSERREQVTWALIPAAILFGFGTLIFIGSLMRLVVPLALLAVGVFLLMRRNHHQ